MSVGRIYEHFLDFAVVIVGEKVVNTVGLPRAAKASPLSAVVTDKKIIASEGEAKSAKYPTATGVITKPMSPQDRNKDRESPRCDGGERSAAYAGSAGPREAVESDHIATPPRKSHCDDSMATLPPAHKV